MTQYGPVLLAYRLEKWPKIQSLWLEGLYCNICYRNMQIQVWIQCRVTSSEVGVLFISRMLLLSFLRPRILHSFTNIAIRKDSPVIKRTLAHSLLQLFTDCLSFGKKGCVASTVAWFYSVLKVKWVGNVTQLWRGVAFKAQFNSKTHVSSLPSVSLERAERVFLITVSLALSTVIETLQVFEHLTA